MSSYYDDSERKLRSDIDTLKERREAIKLEMTCNSPAELFRELSLINYKLNIAESHVNGTFAKQPFQTEYYTRTTN